MCELEIGPLGANAIVHLGQLVRESEEEGLRFLRRLQDEYIMVPIDSADSARSFSGHTSGPSFSPLADST